MSVTAIEAVKAFEAHGATGVHHIAVQSKLREWGATAEESATALQEAIDRGLLLLDSLGSVHKP